MKRDLYHVLNSAVTLSPAARTANANGTGVAMAGYAAAMVEVVTGTITDGTHTFTIVESDDNATWTSVAATDLLGTAPVINNTNSNSTFKVGYIGQKAYLAANVAVTGATTGGVYCATIVRGVPLHAPV